MRWEKLGRMWELLGAGIKRRCWEEELGRGVGRMWELLGEGIKRRCLEEEAGFRKSC